MHMMRRAALASAAEPVIIPVRTYDEDHSGHQEINFIFQEKLLGHKECKPGCK